MGPITELNEMTPDKLIEVLKRYQRESNQSERTLASRIGVNHHTVNRWLKDTQCPTKGPLALAASFLRRVGYL
jgi:DNA-binding XRE family transcriptional regulator